MINPQTTYRLLLMGCLLPLSGCEGTLGIPGSDSTKTGPDSASGSDSGSSAPVDAPEGVEELYEGGSQWGIPALSDDPISSPMVRLLQTEYRQTVAEAFGTRAADAVSLPNDATDGVFLINAHDNLGDYGGYVTAASSVAEQLAPDLLGTCTFEATPSDCFATLSESLGSLLRTELSAEEVSELTTLFNDSVSEGASTTVALEGALLRVLLDERFLFRFEFGSGEMNREGEALTNEELAARLSYWMLDGPPDGGLLAAASDPAALELEVERLLENEAFRDVVWQFVSGWLGIPAEPTGVDGLAASMHEETRRFVEDVLFEQQAPLSELFTANYSFLDPTMAEHYGVTGPAEGFQRVELDPSTGRRGILTHASFLSANGKEERDVSWIFRGKIVYEHLFCGHLPAPPPGVADIEVESREAPGTACASCHTIVDPTGRIFDMFDAHGAILDDPAGDSGVRFGTDIDAEFPDPIALAETLPESLAFHHCTARMWFRFGLGREPHIADGTSLAAIEEVLRAEGSIFDLAQALVTSPAFSQLYVQPSEAVCQ